MYSIQGFPKNISKYIKNRGMTDWLTHWLSINAKPKQYILETFNLESIFILWFSEKGFFEINPLTKGV